MSRKHCLGINTVHTFVEQQKWKLFNQVDCSSRASYDNENEVSSIIIDNDFKTSIKMPKICFKCYVCRRPYYYLANAYFLIFLITTTAFGMFSIDCKLPQNRLQTTLTILLTSVSFKWVVNRSLPTVCLKIYIFGSLISKLYFRFVIRRHWMNTLFCVFFICV